MTSPTRPGPGAEDRVRRHVVVHGKVQAVGYRVSCARRAGRLGVDGWVRNRRDATVEAVFEGSHDAVHEMVEWCRRGPPMAVVDDVAVTDEMPQGESGFAIR